MSCQISQTIFLVQTEQTSGKWFNNACKIMFESSYYLRLKDQLLGMPLQPFFIDIFQNRVGFKEIKEVPWNDLIKALNMLFVNATGQGLSSLCMETLCNKITGGENIYGIFQH